jgi:hypothetical protein
VPDYRQADLDEARKLVPDAGSKAQERVAKALAARERLGALREWGARENVTAAELQAVLDMHERGELAREVAGG